MNDLYIRVGELICDSCMGNRAIYSMGKCKHCDGTGQVPIRSECDKCDGHGKLDWIENASGCKTKKKKQKNNYCSDDDIPF